jgi:hypothetical protein
MSILLPPLSNAAHILKTFLSTKAIEVPLNVAQEAVARTRGHSSFQAAVALAQTAAPALRAVATETAPGEPQPASPLACVEGCGLWCVTGRESGDDDDSVWTGWAASEGEAHNRFLLNALDFSQDDIDQALDRENDPAYFIINTDQLGVVTNGQFVLSASLLP